MKASFASRLNQIMAERNLNQSEVSRLCQPYAKKYGISIASQAISRYCRGLVFPNDDSIAILSQALGVPEIWLLGYETADAVSQEELELVSAWRLCSDKERETIAFILKDYGFVLEKKSTTSVDIA